MNRVGNKLPTLPNYHSCLRRNDSERWKTLETGSNQVGCDVCFHVVVLNYGYGKCEFVYY